MNKKTVPFFDRHSYSPFITVPILGAIFFSIIPYISLFLFNSRSMVIISACCGIVLIPRFLSRMYKINYFMIAGVWFFFIIASLLTMPKEWEGNPKLAFADHFLPGIALSLICSIMLITYLLKKKNS